MKTCSKMHPEMPPKAQPEPQHTMQQRTQVKPAKRSQHPFVGYAFAIAAAIGWACGGLLSNWLMTAPGPDTVGWMFQPAGIAIAPTVLSGARALSATLILAVLLGVFKPGSFKLEDPKRSLLFLVPFGAIALSGMHFTYFKAISTSNVTTAILLEYLAPVFTLLFGVAVLKQKPSWRMPLGVVLSILGCAVVVGAFEPGGLLISSQGLFWGLAAALLFALYSIMGGIGSKTYKPFTLLFYGLVFAACLWLVVLGPAAVLRPFFSSSSGIAILVMAVIATIIPFACYLISLNYISPTQASIAAMLEPVIAGLGSWALYGTKITPSLAVGGAIIIGAIILIQSTSSGELAEFPPQD